MRAGCGPPESATAAGLSSLFLAANLPAWRDVHDLAKLLIDCGAAVNAMDNDGETPLDETYDKDEVRAMLRRHGGRCAHYDC